MTVKCFGPDTPCDLVLAGANLGGDSAGRVPGSLTEVQLSSRDPTGREFAVLSVGEANVGLHGAGRSLQSLQSALHGGVHTAITSLWKVVDAATRRRLELFSATLREEASARAKRRGKGSARCTRKAIRCATGPSGMLTDGPRWSRPRRALCDMRLLYEHVRISRVLRSKRANGLELPTKRVSSRAVALHQAPLAL